MAKVARLLTADPATVKMGLAFFEHDLLVDCVLIHCRESSLSERVYSGSKDAQAFLARHPADLILVECPQAYPGSPVDPNDLIKVALFAGGAAWLSGCRCELPFPRAWKGTTDKDVMCRRIVSRLKPSELPLLEPFKKKKRTGEVVFDDNVVDAVGIGLWYFGRLS